MGSGFDLPESEGSNPRNRSSGNTTVNSEKYVSSQTNANSSLMRVGKNIMSNEQSPYDTPAKAERKK